MKILAILILFSTLNAWGTCNTPISRVNNSANAELTSVKYNNDNNNAYNKINDLEGSCITDGTVTADKLDTSTLAPMTRGIQRGCEVTRASASALSVDDCLLSINGNQVSTATATTVSFGCGTCSAEATGTNYFLYAQSTSDGSTLTLNISTVSPADSTGYDSSNNLVLGRFHNGFDGDIDQYSIDQYRVNQFVPQNTGWINGGVNVITGITTDPTKGTTTTDVVYWRRDGKDIIVKTEYRATSGGTSGTGNYLHLVPNGHVIAAIFSFDTFPTNTDETTSGALSVLPSSGWFARNSSNRGEAVVLLYDTTHVRALTKKLFTNSVLHGQGGNNYSLSEAALGFSFNYRAPIEGWSK